MQGPQLAEDYHSLAYGAMGGNLLLASDRSKLVSYAAGSSGTWTKLERAVGEGSIKDVYVHGSVGQVYVLVHQLRSWATYTHCAPCPSNSFSQAGSTTQGINVCKCRQDFFGILSRYVSAVSCCLLKVAQFLIVYPISDQECRICTRIVGENHPLFT